MHKALTALRRPTPKALVRWTIRVFAPAVLLALVAAVPPADSAAKPKRAEILEFSFSGGGGDRLRGPARGDEFGSAKGADAAPGPAPAGCLIGAPGALDGAGRAVVHDCGNVDGIAGGQVFTVDGDDLAGGPVARFGETLATLGHVESSPAAHWVVGAPGRGEADGPDSAVVVLHPEGDRLVERMRLSSSPEARLGFAVTPLEHGGAGNFFLTFVAGAPGESSGKRSHAGVVHRIDTVSGDVLWSRRGSRRNQYLGYSLRTLPDLDGDGIPEILAGAPGRPNRKPAGEVWLLSGGDGRVLQRFPAPEDAVLFGFALTRADFDGDGETDLAVGAPRTPTAAGPDAGAVYGFRLDGTPLFRWEGETAGQWLGFDVATSFTNGAAMLPSVAASSVYADPDRPKKDRRGGVAVFDPRTGAVVGKKLGKRGGDRLGARILACSESCEVQVPRRPEFFAPE